MGANQITSSDIHTHPRTVLITGATRGLGLAAAQQMAQQGWLVVIVGRNPARIATALQIIRGSTATGRVEALLGDLSSQSEVHRVAQEFLARYPRLDVLINNVGVSVMRYAETVDGVETSWAVNYLNQFLLVQLLRERLQTTAAATGEARIVEIGSSMYRFARNDFTRRPGKKLFNGALAYAYTKRALLLFTQEACQQLAGTGISINTITPGFVATNVAADNPGWTRAIMSAIRRFSLPVDEGARPIVRLAVDPQLRGVQGKYFYRFRQQELPVQDVQAAKALWAYSLQATQ